jgi:hypothetical protein
MIDWRSLAIELFPEMKEIYQQENETVWQVYFDLFPSAIEAHKENNIEKLTRIYCFSEWCHTQKEAEPELWEAASAAFYEHLIDDEVTFKAIPYWVKPEIFRDIQDELQSRLKNAEQYPLKQTERFHSLLLIYNKVNGTDFT